MNLNPRNPLQRIPNGLATALAALALAAISTAHAATYTSVMDGDWNTPATWGETTALPAATYVIETSADLGVNDPWVPQHLALWQPLSPSPTPCPLNPAANSSPASR
jgi:hypothetical protein